MNLSEMISSGLAAPGIATSVQTVSVVVGVVISVLSFNAARNTEAVTRRIEAAKPFLELRQKLYTEALQTAAILTNPASHSAEELAAAKKRFRDLYVAELSMVEAPAVESKMVNLAAQVDPELINLTEPQKAAYQLSHALRDSFAASYGIGE